MAAPNSQSIELEAGGSGEEHEKYFTGETSDRSFVPLKRSCTTTRNGMIESSLKRICSAIDLLFKNLEKETAQIKQLIQFIKKTQKDKKNKMKKFLGMMS